MCSGGLNIRYSLDSPVEKQVSWITHPDFREPPGRYAKSQLLAAPNARPVQWRLLDSGTAAGWKGAHARQRAKRSVSAGPPGPICDVRQIRLVTPAPAPSSTPTIAVFASEMPRVCSKTLAGRFGGKFEAEGCAGGARQQSRYARALLRTYMRDTGGKSGRRPGRHLQVEASGSEKCRGCAAKACGPIRGKV